MYFPNMLHEISRNRFEIDHGRNIMDRLVRNDQQAYYAFKIYDMDNDGYISMSDLYDTLRCLTREELTKEEINLVVQKVRSRLPSINDWSLSIVIVF